NPGISTLPPAAPGPAGGAEAAENVGATCHAHITGPGGHGPDQHNSAPIQKHPDTRLQEGQYESSVPVILDRCHQARVKNALEPEWEARFEPRVRHEVHCCIARAAGRDERRYLWI